MDEIDSQIDRIDRVAGKMHDHNVRMVNDHLDAADRIVARKAAEQIIAITPQVVAADPTL